MQWALLDGQTQPVTKLEAGSGGAMVLEPAEANPQLQRFVRKDGFDSDRELLLPRYYEPPSELNQHLDGQSDGLQLPPVRVLLPAAGAAAVLRVPRRAQHCC